MSSHANNLYKPMNVGFVDIDITETSSNIALRILTDHSIDMESFGAHGKTCVLLMVYLTKAVSDKARHYVFNNGHLNLYKMRIMLYTMWQMVEMHEMNEVTY
ncbi:unnamed protein product [Urochloa humidicola]